ncbi:MAG: cell envelope integrity protein TolA [Flavobacteriales bacterium]|nr:cell envelope integrity protein TolA [Flavobacteriales bacterium]
MNKDISILVVSVVLLSFFSTTEINFKAWNPPSLEYNYVTLPEPNIDLTSSNVSVLGLVTNYFSNSQKVLLSTFFPSIDIEIEIENNIELDDSYTNKQKEIAVKSNYENNQNAYNSNSISEEQILANAEHERVLLEIAEEEARLVAEVAKEEARLAAEVAEEEVRLAAEVANQILKDSIISAIAEQERLALEAIEQQRLVSAEQARQKALAEEMKNKEIAKAKKDKRLKEIAFKDSIMKNENIKENAKELIIEYLNDKIITQKDVEFLLNKYADSKLKKKNIKEFLK